MLTEDVVWREVRDNILYSRRLLTKTNRVPDWGKRFIGTQAVAIVEESLVDPSQKILVTYTRNIGYNKVMVSCCLKMYLENDMIRGTSGMIEFRKKQSEVKGFLTPRGEGKMMSPSLEHHIYKKNPQN